MTMHHDNRDQLTDAWRCCWVWACHGFQHPTNSSKQNQKDSKGQLATLVRKTMSKCKPYAPFIPPPQKQHAGHSCAAPLNHWPPRLAASALASLAPSHSGCWHLHVTFMSRLQIAAKPVSEVRPADSADTRLPAGGLPCCCCTAAAHCAAAISAACIRLQYQTDPTRSSYEHTHHLLLHSSI